MSLGDGKDMNIGLFLEIEDVALAYQAITDEPYPDALIGAPDALPTRSR
jgi:hypothetical protein